MINEQIRDKEVLLIGENGEKVGIMSPKEALKLAREAELDLVKIAPTAKPPVCKIIDYGKYRYELARKEKEAKKKQKVIEVKEVRLSPNIDTNDLNTKMSAARKFLEKGDKVKVTLRFRGREMAHMARKEKEAKKKQKVIEVKEVRLSPNIDTNDLNTKMSAARKFLEKGDKVKVTLRFRGREMAHMAKSKYILDDFAENLSDIAAIDKPSKVEGRSMVMFLTAKR